MRKPDLAGYSLWLSLVWLSVGLMFFVYVTDGHPAIALALGVNALVMIIMASKRLS